MVQSSAIQGVFSIFRTKRFGKGLRRSRRYSCGPATIGKVSFPDDVESRVALVVNLSKVGIGLKMEQPLEVGRRVLLRIRILGEPLPRVFQLTTIHATPETDQTWRVGCEFVEPLSSDVLELLLQ